MHRACNFCYFQNPFFPHRFRILLSSEVCSLLNFFPETKAKAKPFNIELWLQYVLHLLMSFHSLRLYILHSLHISATGTERNFSNSYQNPNK